MRRTWLLWTIFIICLAIGLAAMGWISLTVLHLETESRRKDQTEENIRLALWRIDSTLAPLIAQETARPSVDYTPFTPADRAYANIPNSTVAGQLLLPSPLLGQSSPLIKVHFQFGPGGALCSPQVPVGAMRELAIGQITTSQQIEAAEQALSQVRARVEPASLLALLPREQIKPVGAIQFPQIIQANPPMQQTDRLPGKSQQYAKSANERQARNNSQDIANSFEYGNNRDRGAAGAAAISGGRFHEGVMRPLWLGDMLLLARRVSIDDAEYIQGCWLDWSQIGASLPASVADLLPAARLEPITPSDADEQPRRLAAIPAKLVPGEVPFAPDGSLSPIRMTLLIAWAGLLIGSSAIGVLLWGAIALGERRGAFVSAVTHELRTPLTTVSMYAEMLEEGMVRDEQQRRQYLSTLRTEAGRLGHLVENVLAFSRIERGRASARLQDMPMSLLIDGVKKRLCDRAAQAGMDFTVEFADGAADVVVRADASAVEQILFNLVDNAGKYASAQPDHRLCLTAERNGRIATLALSDHGPGISETDARKLFRPFSKSAKDAANSAPGVGLGLALSRRLARQMRGDLRLADGVSDGACFVLTLPLA